MLKSCFLSSFVEFRWAVSEKKSEMSQPIRGRWGLASCQVSLNSVQRCQRSRKCLRQSEDLEVLLPVKFRWIPFCGIRGEVENVSANQRPGRPSDRPDIHTIGRRRRDLASCQVSLNPAKRFQRKSRKYLSQSEVRAIFFSIVPKDANFVGYLVEILLLVTFRWVPLKVH